MADNAHTGPISVFRVRDMPARMRPREEAERVGIEHVSDEVLLAILLRSGVKGANVVDLARALLQRFGSLTAIAKASPQELKKVGGVGPVKVQVLKAALELAKRLTEEATPDGQVVKSPEDAARLVREKARTLDQERFWVLLLDSKNRVKSPPVDITQGLLNASLVHPREVFREAIRTASAAVVLVHNHPSGDPTPSVEDVRITRQLVSAGQVVDIRVLDHVIVGASAPDRRADYVSLREAGVVDFESPAREEFALKRAASPAVNEGQ